MITQDDLNLARNNLQAEIIDCLPLHCADARHERLMRAIDQLVLMHLALYSQHNQVASNEGRTFL